MTRASIAGPESSLLADVSFDAGWAMLERFSSLVRESGSPDEHAAAEYISAELGRLGVPHELYEPALYLSLPRESSVAHGDARLRAKPPSFAVPTGPDGLTGSLVHVEATAVRSQRDLFTTHAGELPDVRGRIVLTEGYAMPAAVAQLERAGAAGQIYINPGANIHWGICTSIWGTPTTGDLTRKPKTPVVAINREDGDRLRAATRDGGATVTLRVALEEGWYPCKLPVARIAGRTDEFMLVHGHYDSWDVGIGDNAVGDATLLELARIFNGRAGELERSLWIAWWPAHSTGRYGGSTWFADEFALELRKRCVGAVNIDSPGCWHATEYDDVMWMAEAGDLCGAAIRDVAGKEPRRLRPLRAGDYSFNQIGLTSFYMLLSNIRAEEREALGFYPTGGCGGNIAWHTEDDVLDVAERANLERDLRVYVSSICRVLDARLLPYDFRATASELSEFVGQYAEAAGSLLDLSALAAELDALASSLADFYQRIDAGVDDGQVAAVNAVLVELSRVLVPVGYAEGGRFEHDPALPRAPIPRLSRVHELATCAGQDPDLLPFLQTELRRAANHVANAFFEADQAVRGVLAGLSSSDER